MRPIVLNRKNALFAGHDQGAENWAAIASLVETCKLHGVDPQAYFADVLTAIDEKSINTDQFSSEAPDLAAGERSAPNRPDGWSRPPPAHPVEASAAELLNIINFGERAAGAGRPIGQIFVACLAHEVRSIGEEQNAPKAGMSEQTIRQGAGGERLPAPVAICTKARGWL